MAVPRRRVVEVFREWIQYVSITDDESCTLLLAQKCLQRKKNRAFQLYSIRWEIVVKIWFANATFSMSFSYSKFCEVSIIQYIMRWVIRRKVAVQTPDQTLKRNSSMTQQISVKNCNSKNEIAMKSFLKICSSEPTLKFTYCLMQKINALNIIGGRN